MPIIDEALLEPVARYLRFINGYKYIVADRPLAVLDLGCGPKIRFFHFLKKKKVRIQKYVGIDPLVDKNLENELSETNKIRIIHHPLVKKIQIPDGSFDLIVAFAFFEHIDHPREILAESWRLLKKGGRLIITVPSPLAKTFLEIMSHKLGIISTREIDEHKIYFDKKLLLEYLPSQIKKKQISHQYFELGLNNLLIIKK